jgi:hypothetical protein
MFKRARIYDIASLITGVGGCGFAFQQYLANKQDPVLTERVFNAEMQKFNKVLKEQNLDFRLNNAKKQYERLERQFNLLKEQEEAKKALKVQLQSAQELKKEELVADLEISIEKVEKSIRTSQELVRNNIEDLGEALKEEQEQQRLEDSTVMPSNVDTDTVLDSYVGSSTESEGKSLSTNVKRFLSDSNSNFNGFEELLKKYQEFLKTLSQEQLALLFNLSLSFATFCLVLSYLTIMFGDQLILYFNLKSHFPKLVFLINLKRKLNRYSMTFYLTMIVIFILTQIFINAYSLFLLIN